MGRSTIPVDLTNPGQVFACVGLMEAAEVLFGAASGVFEWNQSAATNFQLDAARTSNPIRAVVEFVSQAEVSILAPFGSSIDTSGPPWKIPTLRATEDAFPSAAPEQPATLPAVLRGSGRELQIDYWTDSVDATGRDSVKLWAGSAGQPGAAVAKKAIAILTGYDPGSSPFSFSAPMSGGFGFDWRRDYVPIDVGFSPNRHTSVVMVGYPIVELLAAIGLTHARPRRGTDKLHYRYSVIGSTDRDPPSLPLPLHRAALGGTELPFPQRFFEITLGWPGKEGQARCILEVTEETPA